MFNKKNIILKWFVFSLVIIFISALLPLQEPYKIIVMISIMVMLLTIYEILHVLLLKNKINKELEKKEIILSKSLNLIDNNIMLIKVSNTGLIYFVSNAFLKYSNLEKDFIKNNSIKNILNISIKDYDKMKKVKEGNTVKHIANFQLDLDKWTNFTIIPEYKNKVFIGNSMIFEDFSISKELEVFNMNLKKEVFIKTKELEHQLYEDDLTNLENRNALKRDFDLKPFIDVLLIDISKFSRINNVYGIETANNILVEYSKFLKNIANNEYRVYIISSDQFVFVNYNENKKITKEIVSELISQIESHVFKVKNNNKYMEIQLNVFSSVATNNNDNKDPLIEADMALHYGKKNNRNIVFFNEEKNILDISKKALESIQMVKDSLKEDRVVPVRQPIIKSNGEITFECLVRIKEKNSNNLLTPYHFLDYVKSTKYYYEITKVMINKSFDYFSKYSDISFSINISFEDIINEDFVAFLKYKIKEKKVYTQLILEIVESENIEDFKIVKKFIDEMKEIGVRIAIDDFGSGYSNFNYTLEIKPDFIKIDGSLIKDIAINESSLHITTTIVDFCKKMDIGIIIEYVHSEEVFKIGKEIGVDGFQGYFLGKPEEFLDNPI